MRVVREEIMKRFDKVEVIGDPKRGRSNFIKGCSNRPVRVHPRVGVHGLIVSR